MAKKTLKVIDTAGKAAGTISVSEALFAAPVNRQLLAQAVRVWRANQREGSAHTKTRGEVSGSTRKIYRQKGTGRARHGGIRAPIFIGGGIVFGPRARTIRMSMTKKMRRGALAAALTQKHAADEVRVVAGVKDIEPKTKAASRLFGSLAVEKPALFVLARDAGGVRRAVRNLEGIDITGAKDISAYDILSHKTIVFMKEAVAEL